MNWINIEARFLRSPEYIGSSPEERGTWLNVLAYCVDQECTGKVLGGVNWKDRQWQQTCGVTKNEVMRSSKLLIADGEDIVVVGYPSQKEEEVKAKRAQAKAAIAQRWNTSRNTSRITECGTSRNTSSDTEGEGEGERELEREGERKECEETISVAGEPAPSGSSASDSLFPETPKAKARRPVLTDAEWLADLKADPTYSHVNIDHEHGKMLRWCEAKRKQPTRMRFLNWIGRIERPMHAQANAEPARIRV